jgi:hypothetical protein
MVVVDTQPSGHLFAASHLLFIHDYVLNQRALSGELAARELLAVTEAPDYPDSFPDDMAFTMKILTIHFEDKYTLISINKACAWALYALVIKKELPLSRPFEATDTLPENQKIQFRNILKFVRRNDLDQLNARVKRKDPVNSVKSGSKSRPNKHLKCNQCNNAKRGVLTPTLKSPRSPTSPPTGPLGPVGEEVHLGDQLSMGEGGQNEGVEEEQDYVAKEWEWGYIPPQEAELGSDMPPAIEGSVSPSDWSIYSSDESPAIEGSVSSSDWSIHSSDESPA